MNSEKIPYRTECHRNAKLQIRPGSRAMTRRDFIQGAAEKTENAKTLAQFYRAGFWSPGTARKTMERLSVFFRREV